MTDTTVDIELVASCSEMKVNRVLTELYYDAMTQGPDVYKRQVCGIPVSVPLPA